MLIHLLAFFEWSFHLQLFVICFNLFIKSKNDFKFVSVKVCRDFVSKICTKQCFVSMSSSAGVCKPWLTGNVATNWENCKWKKCTACLWRLKKQQTTYKQSHRVSSLQAKARWETKQPSKHTRTISNKYKHTKVFVENEKKISSQFNAAVLATIAIFARNGKIKCHENVKNSLLTGNETSKHPWFTRFVDSLCCGNFITHDKNQKKNSRKGNCQEIQNELKSLNLHFYDDKWFRKSVMMAGDGNSF